MADQSKLCSLTNNTGKDVVVALTISDDETASQNAVISASHQLEILKTSAGNTVIKNGSSDTVTLDHNYKEGADETGYVQGYDLVVSDSTWLYPLADLAVVQQGSNGTASYAPQTVDAANQAPMAQAFDFYQTIAAYPSSQLATDYMTTLVQARDTASANADGGPGSAEAVADAIENTMDSFFNGTDQYKNVTLADIVAVDNYYNSFPCVWAQYKDSITYYLYGSDGTTAVFSGTLSLAKSGAVDITKPNGGYTCSFAPAVNSVDTTKTDVDTTKLVNLIYVDGLFLDDVTVDTPAIGLKGSFQLERFFTNDPDNNAVIVVLTGTVNGMTCIGFDSPQPAPPKTTSVQTATPTALSASPAEKYWDTLIHPKSQQDLIISILTLVGAILLIPATAFAVYGIYRIIKYKQQAKEPVSNDQVETIKIKLTAAQRAKIERDYLRVAGPKNAPEFDDLSDKEILEYKTRAETLQNAKNSVQLQEAFKMQEDCLNEALKYKTVLDKVDKPTVRLINDSLSSIRDTIYNVLWDTPFGQLGSVLPGAYENFSKVQANLGKINIAVDKYFTDDQKAMVATNMENSASKYEDIQKSNEENAKEETETNPEISEGGIKPPLEE